MKKFILTFCVGINALFAISQQLPQYSSYMINNYILNPGVTGSNDYYEAKALNRYQWKGIDDAPRTYVVSVHGPFRKYNMGIGGFIFSDVTGPTSRTGGYITYAYHLKLTEKLKLNFGLAAGFLQFKIDGSKITTKTSGDPVLNGGVLAAYQPDFNFGLYLNHEKYFVGLACNQIIGNKLKFYKDQQNIRSNLDRHFLINGGYNFFIGSKFVVQPSFMLTYVAPVPVQIQGGLQVKYNDFIWLGATYRHNDAVSAILGFNIKDLILVGYSYDFATSRLKSYSSGTHEIMVGAKFGKIKNKTVEPTNPVEENVPAATPEEPIKEENKPTEPK
jgi:type IX secretion system PorP/SprF family membrane protein